MKLNLETRLLFKAKLTSFHVLPGTLIDVLESFKDDLQMRTLWEEVGILDAFIKKSRPVFRGTLYYRKLTQVLKMFKNIDELQLSQLSDWFVSLLKEKSLPCREAFLVSLIRLHLNYQLFKDLIPLLIKTAIEFKRLGQIGHHPSTVVFAFALLGSLRVIVLTSMETLKTKFELLVNWIGYFPVAGRTPAFAEEILKKLPMEITVQTQQEGFQITRKTDQVLNIINHQIGEYLILPAEDPDQIQRINHPQKRPNVDEGSLTPSAAKKPASGRKLSLFDRMQYTGSSSQAPSSAEASSKEKSTSLTSQVPPPSGGASKAHQSKTWESWFSDDRTPTPQKSKKKKRSKSHH